MTAGSDGSSDAEQPLGADRPITKGEQDRLGYAPFARAIAKSIVGRAPADSIVLAIHGPWGSGKTSAVNLIVEAIGELQKDTEEQRTTAVVRFNPWWFSEQLNLTRTFFAELSAALEQKMTSRVTEGLRKIGRRVSGTKDLLTAGLGLLPGGGVAAPLVKGAFDALQPYLDDHGSIDKLRSELVEALNEQTKRVLVIIDDIDRLPPDECRQIFRLVKSVADLPRITYLLLFDRELVRRAIGEMAVNSEPEWLEKIVQCTFDLPPVHPVDLQRIFIDGLSRIIGEADTADQVRAGNVLYDAVFPWLRTPRDVGRLLNAISVSWPVVQEDVNVVDFIAVETLRVFENRVFMLIRDNPRSLTGVARSRAEVDSQLGQDLKAAVSEARRNQIESALKRLFPRLELVWGNQTYSAEVMLGWDRELRICSERRFPTYFQFAPAEDVLPRSEVTALKAALLDREQLMTIARRSIEQKRRSGGTRADLVLAEIRMLAENLEEERVPDAYLNLMHVAPVFAHGLRDGTGSGFDLPITWSLHFAVRPLFERFSPDGRVEMLARAIDEVPDLISANFNVTAIEGEHGMYEGAQAKPPEERLVDEAGLLKLRERLQGRIAEMANNGTLLEQIEPLLLLHRWVDLAGEEVVKQWSNTIIANDEGALKLADLFTDIGTGWGHGDRVTRIFKRVDRKSVSTLVDVGILSERLRDIVRRGADPNGTARDFLKALETRNPWDS